MGVLTRLLALSVLISTVAICPSAYSASCPVGKIECGAWCAKYRPGTSQCMSGLSNSCDAKPGGARACVNDRKPDDQISCQAWCSKCKPDAGCSSSCDRMNNRMVNASCSFRQ